MPKPSAKPLLSIALVVAVLASLPAGAGDLSDPYEKTLHPNFPSTLSPQLTMEETDELVIVPVSRLMANLSQTEVEDPLPPEQVSALVEYVNLVAERRKTHRKVCHISPADWSRPAPRSDPKEPAGVDLRSVIEVQPSVFLGTIENLSPAWDFQYETVVSIVFFRVEEVLADASGVISPGDLVTHVRQWGEMAILGVDFCTNPPVGVSADSAPGVGDQLILTGVDDLRNPKHLVVIPEGIYPVVGGLVTPPEANTSPRGYSNRAATLNEIRELFR